MTPHEQHLTDDQLRVIANDAMEWLDKYSEYEDQHGIFFVNIKRHEKTIVKQGGDEYMGYWEMCEETEISHTIVVFDEEGERYPALDMVVGEYFENAIAEVMEAERDPYVSGFSPREAYDPYFGQRI